MRATARRLNTGRFSLYDHVPNELESDRLLAEELIADPAGGTPDLDGHPL